MKIDHDMHLLTLYFSLLATGLAGSLHCIGMCGPILLGFAEIFDRTSLTVRGRRVDERRDLGRWHGLIRDFACYHIGRVWTYGVLGFFAGILGQKVRTSGEILGWQGSMAVVLSVAVMVTGVMLLGLVPTGKIGAWLNGCGIHRLTRQGWIAALTRSRGVVARLLLGAVMGLLPCGLVYAVLLVAATLPNPLHSAVGMVVFGLGTLPSLSGVLLARRVIPPGLRAHGTRLAAVFVILTGAVMLGRTLVATPQYNGDDVVLPTCHTLPPSQ